MNIPESLREIIAERLSDPTATMFDEAQAEVISLMRSDLFSVCFTLLFIIIFWCFLLLCLFGFNILD